MYKEINQRVNVTILLSVFPFFPSILSLFLGGLANLETNYNLSFFLLFFTNCLPIFLPRRKKKGIRMTVNRKMTVRRERTMDKETGL